MIAEEHSHCVAAAQYLLNKYARACLIGAMPNKCCKRGHSVPADFVPRVFFLRYDKKMATEDIAAELDCHANTVRNILLRRHKHARNFPKHPSEKKTRIVR